MSCGREGISAPMSYREALRSPSADSSLWEQGRDKGERKHGPNLTSTSSHKTALVPPDYSAKVAPREQPQSLPSSTAGPLRGGLYWATPAREPVALPLSCTLLPPRKFLLFLSVSFPYCSSHHWVSDSESAAGSPGYPQCGHRGWHCCMSQCGRP